MLDYRSQDIPASGARWDVVLDTPGRYNLAGLRDVLSVGGVLVSTRPVPARSLRALATAPLRRSGQRFTAVMTRARSQDLTLLAALVDQGRLRVPLDGGYPLAQAAAAHRHAEGPVTGKVAVRVAADGPGDAVTPGPQL